MGKINFTALKNSRKAVEDSIDDTIPEELESSYTDVWGSNKENIIYIETTRLVPFTDKDGNSQPFKLNSHKVAQIAASAKDIGIVSPLNVRRKGDIYEIISGHHRLAAAKEIGQLKVPCIIRSYSDDEMLIVLAESNIQRDKILPSEYYGIFSKYLRLRTDEETTVAEISEKFDVSRKTFYRYINIGKLIEPLREMTDNKRINIGAVDIISQLSSSAQTALAAALESSGKSISVSTAKQMKDTDASSEDDFISILENQKAAKTMYSKMITKYFKPDTSQDEIDSTIQKALELYFNHNSENS